MTATGVIDVIIPPSIPMIIYGIAAQQSVPQLFLAGFVPGILIGIALAIYVYFYARSKEHPGRSAAEPGTACRTMLKDSVWSILAPVVILGGIYGGLFTPTEAAGVACIYAIVMSLFVYREITWRRPVGDHRRIGDAQRAGADHRLGRRRIRLADHHQRLSGASSSRSCRACKLETWMLLLVINIILLFVGSVLEPPAAILMLTPLLTPIAYAAGVDPIHFGIIVTVNLAIGMFMPPFGLNLFAANALFKTPLPELYRGVMPFLLIYLAMLMLITYIPAITLAPLALFR